MFNVQTYTQRRKSLVSKMKSGIILLLGNNESPMNYPANTYHFRQDSSFLYFFGLNEPGLAAIIDIDNDKEVIFGNDIDLDDIIWMGPQPSLIERAALCGVKETRAFVELENFIKNNLPTRNIHYLPPYRHDNMILIDNILGIKPSEQKKLASVELIKEIVNLRSKKEAQEIAAIEKAMYVAYLMHTSAMKMTKAGVYEREIAGAMEGIALAHGCTVSFPIILTKNGQTLHNHYHGNKLNNGELVLVDAGIESPEFYCTDHTRTFPVSGKFTAKQKEIYDIVLKANEEAISMIKPDISYKSIHLEACKIITEGLKSIGLMTGNTIEAVEQGAHAMFFPHGLGHMMGIDVHDMEDLGQDYVGYNQNVQKSTQFGTAYLRLARELQESFVLTVEPGIYFIPALIEKWKNENKFTQYINYKKVEEYLDFGGIRIEDDVLVTADGYKVFGKPIPKKLSEIENLMLK